MTDSVNDLIEGYDDMTNPEVEEALEDVDPDPDEAMALKEYEKENKDRVGAKDAIEDYIVTDDWGETYNSDYTKNGYRVDDTVSILQKSIRRNDKYRAGWAAWELLRSGIRLETVEPSPDTAVEDIEPGHRVHLLLYRYEMMSKHKHGHSGWAANNIAIHAAVALADAPSTRLATHLQDYYELASEERVEADKEDRDPEIEHPVPMDELRGYTQFDVAKDQHTMWGKRMGRYGDDGWTHFWIHAARVANGEDGLSAEVQRKRLEEAAEQYGITEEEIDHALSAIDDDQLWEEDSLSREDGVTMFRDDE